MVLGQIRAFGGARSQSDETRIEEAHEMALHQGPAGDRCRKLIGHRDGEIDAAGGECFVHSAKLYRAAHETHVRRFVFEKAYVCSFVCPPYLVSHDKHADYGR
jgi:hypothetical protein